MSKIEPELNLNEILRISEADLLEKPSCIPILFNPRAEIKKVEFILAWEVRCMSRTAHMHAHQCICII
jgi:hypothetical protein